MSDQCKLVRTTTETACLMTADGCFKHEREVKTYWCTPHGSSRQHEAYEKRTFTPWVNTNEKCEAPAVRWVPDGPRLTTDEPGMSNKPASISEPKPAAPKPTTI